MKSWRGTQTKVLDTQVAQNHAAWQAAMKWLRLTHAIMELAFLNDNDDNDDEDNKWFPNKTSVFKASGDPWVFK